MRGVERGLPAGDGNAFRIRRLRIKIEHILHAGDIGDPFIPFELEQIAPVTVVVGNNDPDLSFKETEVVELVSRKFLIHHIVRPNALEEKLELRIKRERPAVVVFGHTHKRFSETLRNQRVRRLNNIRAISV